MNCVHVLRTYQEALSQGVEKTPRYVTPAKAGVQKVPKSLDSGFRRNDEKRRWWRFFNTLYTSSFR